MVLSMMVVMTSLTLTFTFRTPGRKAYRPPTAIAASAAQMMTRKRGCPSIHTPTCAAKIAPRSS